MIKLKDILNEEVYGNKATVYHRTRTKELLNIILNSNFEHKSGLYGKGIYTTYMPTWKTNWKKNSKKDKINPVTNKKYTNIQIQRSENPEGRLNYQIYGKYQVKFSVDLINFFIFDWDVYQKVTDHVKKVEQKTGKKSNINNFINLQAEYFKLPHRINSPYRKRYTSELALQFGFDYSYSYSGRSLVNGIIFFGGNDGNVLVCYNKAMLVPIGVINSDTNETINLQKFLKSDMKLNDEFKSYFKKFIKSKDRAMSNIKKSVFVLARDKWNLDKKTNMFNFDGDVEIADELIEDGKLAIKFANVTGDFNCNNEKITSLVGSPEYVGGDFNCSKTKITSLEGAPKEVKGSFICSNTKITSLVGMPEYAGGVYAYNTEITSLVGSPEYVGGDFNCSKTKITSLEGAPKEVRGSFSCTETKITSLEGAPNKVGMDFDCFYTNITSLKGAPKEVGGGFSCASTNITSLEGAPNKVGKGFNCYSTKITSLKGAPKEVGGTFNCSFTDITSLEGAPKEVGVDFNCYNTKITSLKGAPKEVGRTFSCAGCKSLESLEYLPIAKYYQVPDYLKNELQRILKERGEI